jgi:hypothetical protein
LGDPSLIDIDGHTEPMSVTSDWKDHSLKVSQAEAAIPFMDVFFGMNVVFGVPIPFEYIRKEAREKLSM